jgi:ankyrin repeat protein
MIELGATISTEPTVGAIYNSTSDQSGQCTALSIAVTNGHQSTVAALIEAGILTRACRHSSTPMFAPSAQKSIVSAQTSVVTPISSTDESLLHACSGANINTRFHFRTVKGIAKASNGLSKTPSAGNVALRPAEATTGATNAVETAQLGGQQPASTATADSAGTTSPTAVQPQGGGWDLTPILLACANGRLNVVRELLWRHCDCRCAILVQPRNVHIFDLLGAGCGWRRRWVC